MKTTLLMLLFVAAASPALADPHRANRAEPAMTCETVRAYVSQMGLTAAKAVARANGMTASQERRARQCLASLGLTRAAADRQHQVYWARSRSTQTGKFRSS